MNPPKPPARPRARSRTSTVASVAEPGTAKPSAAKPDAAKSSIAKPVAAKPAIAKPSIPKAKAAKQPPAAQAETREQIVRRTAYFLYVARGGVAGHEMEDWLQAEVIVAQETVADGAGDRG